MSTNPVSPATQLIAPPALSPLRGLLLTALLAVGACGGGDPVPSYCEAVCDWAVECAATERSIDEAALTSECLTATRATDEGCANAEEGKLNPATRKAVEGCVSAIDAAAEAGECDGFVGRIDDLKVATAPAACAATGADVQKTFQAAQESVTETGDQLCTRFTETFCGRLDECVIADLGTIPQPVIDQIGTPFDICVARLDFQTQSCQTQDLYQEEQSLTDANTSRQAARECVRDFGSTPCGELLSGEIPELCAGAFTSAEDSLAFALALVEVATDVSEAVEAHNSGE